MSAASATRSTARPATLQALPQPGATVTLSIETYVREDMIRLYGFSSDLEREWFRLLQTVQGVGSRVALGVLGIMKPGELATAIALQDKVAIARAPGVGKKVAERIVAELRDKAPAYSSADPAVISLQADLAERRAPQPVERGGLGAGQSRLCAGRRRAPRSPPRRGRAARRRPPSS